MENDPLQQQIEEVEANIKAVEQQIRELEPQIAAEIASGGPLLQYFIGEKQQLRRKEEQLREEKQQLRRKEEQLREEKQQLLRKEELLLLKFKDPTYEIIRRHQISFLPPIHSLKGFLLTKPDGLVFEIDCENYQAFKSVDREGLFQLGTSESSCRALSDLLNAVRKPKSRGATEFSFIHFWDSLIFDFIELFCVKGVRIGRTTNQDSGTGKCLPDFVVYLGPYPLLRGEEKKPGISLLEPKDELVEKIPEWVFQGLPYLLAYYAVGSTVVVAALCAVGGYAKAIDLISLNLDNLADRLKLVLVNFNLARLLPQMEDLCLEYNIEPDISEPVEDPTSGKTVTMAAHSVLKTYNDEKTFEKVESIYLAIKGIPNAEELSRKRRRDSQLTLVFKPRFLTRRRARPGLGILVDALRDIAMCMKHLHEKGYMHRDLHWRNVGYDPNKAMWGVFDFDEAAPSPCEQAAKLCSRAHAPEMLQGEHDSKVDIWGFGHLIRTAKVDLTCCPALAELRDNCLEDDPRLRPNMDQVIKILHTDCEGLR